MGIYTAIIVYAAIGLAVGALGIVWKNVVRKFVHRDNVREYRHSAANTP